MVRDPPVRVPLPDRRVPPKDRVGRLVAVVALPTHLQRPALQAYAREY